MICTKEGKKRAPELPGISSASPLYRPSPVTSQGFFWHPSSSHLCCVAVAVALSLPCSIIFLFQTHSLSFIIIHRPLSRLDARHYRHSFFAPHGSIKSTCKRRIATLKAKFKPQSQPQNRIPRTMHSSNQFVAVLALVAGIGNVIAQDPASEPQKRGILDLLKRQGTPPGGWNNPANYQGVDWSKVDYSGGSGKQQGGNKAVAPVSPPAPTPQPATPTGNTPNIEQKQAVKPSASAVSSVSPSSGGGGGAGGGGGSSSSASCPSGCQMTISFTDNSLDVPFTAGAGGTPSTGSTKGTCICMHGGSVRINIGSQNSGETTTLVEGYAAGMSSASFFDVSYVMGYTYPVVCWANDGAVMSGSNVDLYAASRSKCPDGTGSKMGDICTNPGYTKLTNNGDACWQCTLPDAFFGPASGAAYTYPRDDSAWTSDGKSHNASPMATGGSLTCCVGTSENGCRSNTMSSGGKTSGGRCDSGCQPCAGHGECQRNPNAPAKHKRHSHRHAAFHAAKGMN